MEKEKTSTPLRPEYAKDIRFEIQAWNEENYQALVEQALDVFLLVNSAGCILYSSLSVHQLLGYQPEEIAGQSLFVFVHPDNLKEALDLLQKDVWIPGFLGHAEFRLQHKDGSWRNVEIVGQQVRDYPLVQGIIIQARDISQRQAVEEALREAQELNTSLLENSPNPILITASDTSIRYVNPILEQLTGYSKDVLLNTQAPYPWWPQANRRKYARILESGFQKGVHQTELRFQKHNGENFWVEINLFPIKSQGRLKYLLSIWKDITEQKDLRDELDSYRQQITLAQEEEKKRLARELHDDTAQSLALLSLELDGLGHSREPLPEKVVQKLEQLKKDVNRTLEDVRRFSHELRPAILDQLGLLAALEFLVEEMNHQGPPVISLIITGKKRRLLNETELALFRIVQEALSNVRKHAGASQATVSIKFTLKKTTLIVADNGKGFDVDKDSQSAVTRGRLGLISIKERAHLVGAKLLIKSCPGQGTIISIEIL